MQEDCDYCQMYIFDAIYSIPLDIYFKKYDGTFCSPQCRLAANKYVENPPHRSLRNWEMRERAIRELDLPNVYKAAPHPRCIKPWNPNGLSRESWVDLSVTNKKIKK